MEIIKSELKYGMDKACLLRYETMLRYVSRQTEKLYPDTAFT